MSSPQDIMNRFKGNPKGASVGSGIIFLGASLAYGIYNSIYTVNPGNASIIFNRIGGIQKTIKKEGIHFRIPWFERPIFYNVRSRPSKITSLSGSKGNMCYIMDVRKI
ncbi:hypothetical protein A3Q56_08019 [Intoshia linei]|uniref:Prohibitin n=1 Tax=Intoshia linei TaxID=1819745 RepID=A0A177ASD1_9BILA|nr:hypothetical protein A3Q56_08019 [Intoshia linei]